MGGVILQERVEPVSLHTVLSSVRACAQGTNNGHEWAEEELKEWGGGK